MNWSRGLFRLWIVLSVLWIGSVALMEAKPGFEGLAQRVQRTDVTASDVVATLNSDGTYTMAADGRSFIVDTSGVTPSDPVIWSRVTGNVAQELNEEAEVANAELNEARAAMILSLLAHATVPPVLLLALGASLLWVLRGFKRKAA